MVYYILKLKIKFNRVRPSFLSSKLKPAIQNPLHPAYPSGHAGESMIAALVLGEFFPEHRERLIKYAKSIGHNREKAGVHYHSDTLAGQKVAQIYFKKLKEEIFFISALEEYKLKREGRRLTKEECERFIDYRNNK